MSWLIAVACTDRPVVSAPTQAEDEVLITSMGAEYLKREVLVRRAPSISDNDFRVVIATLGARLDTHELVSTTLGFERILLPETMTADDAISELRSRGAAAEAERNYLIDSYAVDSYATAADPLPDPLPDPLIDRLWSLARIHAPQAWELYTGDPELIVAVSDTGVDTTHEDLAAHLWTNPNEISGNEKDDDENGYVDDVSGWDWKNSDNDPFDDRGDGTHAAGIIGAVADNGVGVLGINAHVRLLPLKVLGDDGRGSVWDGIQTIVYAQAVGAQVLHVGWGCVDCYSGAMKAAIQQFGAADGLLVARAGSRGKGGKPKAAQKDNKGNDQDEDQDEDKAQRGREKDGGNNDLVPYYPASYRLPNVVAVAATTDQDELSRTSRFGATTVDVAAPGDAVFSTIPGSMYGERSGTTMAAAHVAGAAALYRGYRPQRSASEVKERLRQSCEPKAKLQGLVACNGIIDAFALLHDDGEAPAADFALSAFAGSFLDIEAVWTAPRSLPGVASYRVHLGRASGVYGQSADIELSQRSYVFTGLVSGVTYYLVAAALDATGRELLRSNEASATAVDELGPPQTIDLRVNPHTDSQRVLGFVEAASGSFSSYFGGANAHDGNRETIWMSPVRLAAFEEFIQIALHEMTLLDRVELLASPMHPEFFPRDFDVLVSEDGHAWTHVAERRDVLDVSAYQVVPAYFTATWASHVRLLLRNAEAHISGAHYTSLAEVRLLSPAPATELTVEFTAPGDNPGSGTATRYLLHYGATLPRVDLPPSVVELGPANVAGTIESFVVSALLPETTYYFVLVSQDSVGNASAVSNVAVGTTAVLPPQAVTDLRVEGQTPGQATLVWTAPGDDGASGTAQSYDMRTSAVPISAAEFSSLRAVAEVPAPLVAGTVQRLVLTGLDQQVWTYAALRTTDKAGASSPLSNVVAIRPGDGADRVPPAQADLHAQATPIVKRLAALVSASSAAAAHPATLLQDGDTGSAWSSGSTGENWIGFDLSETRAVSELVVYPSRKPWLAQRAPERVTIVASMDQVLWTPLAVIENLRTQFGAPRTVRLSPTFTRYLRLLLEGEGTDELVLAEVELLGPSGVQDVDLTWLAPGDDGFIGQAARFDVRHGADMILSIIAPGLGGSVQWQRVPALSQHDTHEFVLVALDAAGNQSTSNVARIAENAGVPVPVGDLRVDAAVDHSVSLSFTVPPAPEPTDLGAEPGRYALRYLPHALSFDTWDAATLVPGLALPLAPGATETVIVEDLEHTTEYSFALQVIDAHGQGSILSNVVRAETSDLTPPGRIMDLLAAEPGTDEVPVLTQLVGQSGNFRSFDASYLLDNQAAGPWVTPITAAPTQHWVQLGFDGMRLGKVRISHSEEFYWLFPIALEIQLRFDGQPWTTMVSVPEFSPDGRFTEFEEFELGSVFADELRVLVTPSIQWNGGYVASLGYVSLFEGLSDYASVELSWVAPGDDLYVGTASRYDVLQQTALAGFFDLTATAILGLPAPWAAGTLQRHRVTGLSRQSDYCFAIRAWDEVDNEGALSEPSCLTTGGIPPAKIRDLAIDAVTAHSVELVWTAPGDDQDVGQAASYDVRYFDAPIYSSNWDSAWRWSAAPRPAPAGHRESTTIDGLAALGHYYVAVRAIDRAGYAGVASDTVDATTLDDVPPADVTDLVAVPNPDLSGSLLLSFTAVSDNDQSGQAHRYDAYLSPVPVPENLAGLETAPMQAFAGQAAGTRMAVVATELLLEAPYWVAVRAVDLAGNISGFSAVVATRTREEAPLAITDLHVIGDVSDDTQIAVELGWTAPLDIGLVERTAAYDLRFHTSPIQAYNFAFVSAAASTPTPRAPDALERFVVSGLIPGRLQYFALKSVDVRGNASLISNVVSLTVADNVPPGPVNDLTAATPPAQIGAVALSWTAPGDNGMAGSCSGYDVRYASTPITTQADYDHATRLGVQPLGATGGDRQRFTATRVPHESLLYFALRARDRYANWSAISNTASARTREVAPGLVTMRQDGRTLTSVTIKWAAPGDDLQEGQATEYDLRYSAQAIQTGDATSFSAATRAMPEMTAPRVAGEEETAIITNLLVNRSYYVALKTVDEHDNWSPISNVLRVETGDTIPPSDVDDIVATRGPLPGSIQLAWHAPGDDGDVGRATSYEVYYSPIPFDHAGRATARKVDNPPLPLPSGNGEQLMLQGLLGETTYYFGIVARDEAEAENESRIPFVVSADTAPVPPGAVSTLRAIPTHAGMLLTWRAPYDDEFEGGSVTAYDVRYSQAEITLQNFQQATTIAGPTPQVPRNTEALIVPGLTQDTRYWFALKGIDDMGAVSELSNVADAVAMDVTPPAAPTGLVVTAPPVPGRRLPIASASSSSHQEGDWDAALAIDGQATTAWCSQGTPYAHQPQHLTVDLGEVRAVDHLRLLPHQGFLRLFPRAFLLALSADGVSWSTVHVEESFDVLEAQWLSWGFSARAARYVRLSVSESGESYGAYYALVSELEVYEASPTSGVGQLVWLAPGDDEDVGAPRSYELYYGPSAITEATLAQATLVTPPVIVGASGDPQHARVDGLLGGTRYYWAVRALDETGNIGPLSESVAQTTNHVAPAPTADLRGYQSSAGEVTLYWSAPGDDMLSGQAQSYELRYAGATLQSANFPLLTTVRGLSAPKAPGTNETARVSGLQADRLYRFGVVSRDESGNGSYISNVAYVFVAGPDTTAPAQVRDLQAHAGQAGRHFAQITPLSASHQDAATLAQDMFDADRTTFWSSGPLAESTRAVVRGELAETMIIDTVRLWPALGYERLFPISFQVRVSPDGLAWTKVAQELRLTVIAGQPIEKSFPPLSVRFVEFVALELSQHDNGNYYALVAELEAISAMVRPGEVVLSWTAPGDDGTLGRPSAYDLRFGLCPFAPDTFDTFGRIPLPAPALAGSPERHVLSSLDAGGAGVYCAGLIATDEASNTGALSNIAQIELMEQSHPPVILSMHAWPEVVLGGETVNLNSYAYDPDPADTLTYLWSASSSAGVFSARALASGTWVAPWTAGTYVLTVDVSDGTWTQTADVVVQVERGVPVLKMTPETVDFGFSRLDCCSTERTVTLANVGTGLLTLTDTHLVGAEFVITEALSKTELGPGDTAQMTLRYCPSVLPRTTGELVIGTDDAAIGSVTVALVGEGTLDTEWQDVFGGHSSSQVDVLWIVDDSGSMGEEQIALAGNFEAFIQAAIASNTDYRMGVVWTDVVSEWAGRLYSCTEGTEGVRWISSEMPAEEQRTQFACNVKTMWGAGRPHSAAKEAALQAGELALSEPNLSGYNAGFYRPDAKLFVILVTDELDQSDGTAGHYADFYLNLKGGSREQVNVSAISGPPPNGCATAQSNPKGYDAVQLIGGQFHSICSSDWTDLIRALGLDVFYSQTRFPLSRPASADTITVSVCADDGAGNPIDCVPSPLHSVDGWTFDDQTNAIEFHGTEIPKSGEHVRIDYELLCVSSPTNHAPVCEVLIASRSTMDPGDVVTLSARATDADAGATLSYVFSATDGVLLANGASATWTAPVIEGTYNVAVVVQDDHGAECAMDVNLYVQEEPVPAPGPDPTPTLPRGVIHLVTQGTRPALATDAARNVHLAYYGRGRCHDDDRNTDDACDDELEDGDDDGGGHSLRYGFWNGSGWDFARLDKRRSKDRPAADIAVDAGRDPYVLYHDSPGTHSPHLAEKHGTWTRTKLENGASNAESTVTLVPEGMWLTYGIALDRGFTDLRYAHLDNGTWLFGSIVLDAGNHHDLSVNPVTGLPSAVFTQADGSLYLSSWDGATWLVDPSPLAQVQPGSHVRVRFDPLGVAQVLHVDEAARLVLLRQTPQGFGAEVLDDSIAHSHVRLELTTDGRPAVAYVLRMLEGELPGNPHPHEANQTLVFAAQTLNGWVRQIVAESILGKTVIGSFDLALDSAGAPYVAFTQQHIRGNRSQVYLYAPSGR